MECKTQAVYNVSHHKRKMKKSVNRVIPTWLICGFSLVEMLMALLVASLLLAALAPVMTKRLGGEKLDISAVTSNNGNETHGVKIFEYDAISDSDKDYSKYDFTVPTGVHILSIVVQGAGGGGGGSTSGYTSYNNELNSSSSATQTIKIENNLIGIKNVRVDLTGGGGGGGGAIATVIDCKDPNLHKYINPTQGNGTQQCVNKFNVGDTNGPAITSGMIRCERNETDVLKQEICLACADSTNASFGKCYYPGPYTDCSEDLYGGQTGCNRTSVQYFVAQNACANYTGAGVTKGKWRMPNKTDMTKWGSYVYELNYKQGANGLQICGWEANTVGVPNCGGSKGTCYGSPSNDCDTDRTWMTDTCDASPEMHWGLSAALAAGCWWTDMTKNNALSARCLTTDNDAFTFAYKTGGGGGSGARIHNFTLPETYNGKELLAAGNSITISRGNYGARGASGVNGANGSPSCISIYDANGAQIFYFCANGGNLGKGATSTNYGGAGSAVATCRIGASSSSYQNVNCSSYGSVVSQAGTNGKNSIVEYNASVVGGDGGKSTYNTSLAGGSGGSGSGANNTTQASINGKAPQASGGNIPYGAGGGGGASGRGANSSAIITGEGGDGYVGFAKITYDVERTGGSGGGGGGGAMAAIASLEVTSGTSHEIIAGKGGKGGNVNSNGLDGYKSSFKISSTQSIQGNGGKGGKTGNSENPYGVGGAAGAGGIKSTVNDGYGKTYADGKNGEKGFDYDISGVKKSIGGNGGKSGIGTDGACGGLSFYYKDSSYAADAENNNCMITNTNADSALYLLNTLIMGTDYGKAGSGGGGGGFESYALYGAGGNGANGYVFVKW